MRMMRNIRRNHSRGFRQCAGVDSVILIVKCWITHRQPCSFNWAALKTDLIRALWLVRGNTTRVRRAGAGSDETRGNGSICSIYLHVQPLPVEWNWQMQFASCLCLIV